MKTKAMTEQLELFGCIQCGKCTGGCPVARKTALNIRSMIYHMLVEPELDVHAHEELWDCTCCFTCVERCPKDVRPADLIIGLREQLVVDQRIPKTIGTALMGTFRQGNPTGIALGCAIETLSIWQSRPAIDTVPPPTRSIWPLH